MDNFSPVSFHKNFSCKHIVNHARPKTPVYLKTLKL